MAQGREQEQLRPLKAGLLLASNLALAEVLRRIVETAAQVTDARYGALGVLGAEGHISEFITRGLAPGEYENCTVPHGEGILGVLIRDARPLRLKAISDDVRSIGFPQGHPPMRSFLGAPVTAHGKVFGNIYLTEKRGAQEFSPDDEEALVVLAGQAGIAIENAQLYEEMHRREEWLEALREITNAILSGEQLEKVLEMIAKRARQVGRADVVTIVMPADGGSSLTVKVAEGQGAQQLLGMDIPLQRSISGDVMHSGTLTVVENASADPRSYQPLVNQGRMGPLIAVPLLVRGRAIGTLNVARVRGGKAFESRDVDRIQSFAAQASVALEYDRARRDEQRLAVMDDRERIARELHDGVIQALFAVGMGLQATATRVSDSTAEKRLEGAVSEIDRVIRDLRNYIFGLRPGILADRQLQEALIRLGEEFEEKTGVTTVVDVDGAVAAELASRAADVVQLAREALSNVGRHAEAHTVRVSLQRHEGNALLEIDDDGKGFDVQRPNSSGQGLRNLRERANEIGGEVFIESTLGEGTTVRVGLPL